MKKVGLALGSGGARGFAHVGVIKTLLKNNIQIDYVSGTSIGSVIGAYYCLYGEVDSLEKEFSKFNKRDLLKLVDFNGRVSLIKGKKIKSFINKYLGDATFSDLKIPLWIGATSMESGEKYIFTKGKLIDAVMSSICLPGIFPPYRYDNNYLLDGGITDGTPVSFVKEMGAEVIIAVDLIGKTETEIKNPKMFDTLMRAYRLMVSNLVRYEDWGDNVVVLKPTNRDFGQVFNFHRSQEYIKDGEVEAQKRIYKIKKLLR